MLGKLEEFFGKHKKLVIIGFVICMAVFAGINGYKHIADSKIEKIDYTRFRAMLDKGEITEIEYSQNKEYMTVVASHGSRYKTLHPRYEDCGACNRLCRRTAACLIRRSGKCPDPWAEGTCDWAHMH